MELPMKRLIPMMWGTLGTLLLRNGNGMKHIRNTAVTSARFFVSRTSRGLNRWLFRGRGTGRISFTVRLLDATSELFAENPVDVVGPFPRNALRI